MTAPARTRNGHVTPSPTIARPITKILYHTRNGSFTAYPKYSDGAVFTSKKAFYGRVSSEVQSEWGTYKIAA